MQNDFEKDVPKDLALRAFDNVSHDPRGRGRGRFLITETP